MLLEEKCDLLEKSEKNAHFQLEGRSCWMLESTRYVYTKNLIILIIIRVECLNFLFFPANQGFVPAAFLSPYRDAIPAASSTEKQLLIGKNCQTAERG